MKLGQEEISFLAFYLFGENISMKTHSKVEIEKTFTDGEGNEFTFKAKKLNSFTLQTESFKLLKTLGTAAGTSVDAKAVGMAWSAVSEAIYENFTEEHFDRIRNLLLQEVSWKEAEEDEWKKCTVDFWDESYLILDVTFWLIKENFVNFIQKSGILSQALIRLENLTGLNVKESFEKKVKELTSYES